MRRSIILLTALVAIAGAAQAQSWTVGPADTLPLPVILNDSIGNPIAPDSAADSVFVRVLIGNTTNTKDTSYLFRGLLDASTNAQLHSSGTATNTTFGAKVINSFNFKATAYTLTNSSTTSGPYTVVVSVWDNSLGLLTTRQYGFNYVYGGASTFKYKDHLDSAVIVTRWLAKSIMPDSTSAGYLKADAYSTGGTANTGRDIGASVLLSSGTGTGQISLSSGVAQANMVQVLSNTPDTTGATGRFRVNLGYIGGSAVSTSSAQLGVNAVNIGGTSQTGRDLGSSVLLSNGTGTGQVSLSSGIVQADVAKVAGTAQTAINLGTFLPAALDSLMLAQGYRTGQKAVFKVSANSDTLYVYAANGTTLLFRTVYVHPGGAAGDPPDTSRSVGP